MSIVLFLYVGRWVDGRLGSEPWGMVIGVFTGAGAAFYSMYRKLMTDLRDDEARRRR
ncbi:MAG: AtpZ/AtpI family protein [Cytophagaceae bacterium]|nr:AtpZ/AtpI family protein [Gemmatimonadaceae bacterium]